MMVRAKVLMEIDIDVGNGEFAFREPGIKSTVTELIFAALDDMHMTIRGSSFKTLDFKDVEILGSYKADSDDG